MWIVDKIKAILSEKTKNRIFLYEDSKFLLDLYDEDSLPKIYGGNLDMKFIIEQHKQRIEAKIHDISLLNDIKLNLDLYPKCIINPTRATFVTHKKTIDELIDDEKKIKKIDFEEVRGSFKKLEID